MSRLVIGPVTDSSSLDSRERERARAAILRLRGRALWAEGGTEIVNAPDLYRAVVLL